MPPELHAQALPQSPHSHWEHYLLSDDNKSSQLFFFSNGKRRLAELYKIQKLVKPKFLKFLDGSAEKLKIVSFDFCYTP
jgi:hypothetical protein